MFQRTLQRLRGIPVTTPTRRRNSVLSRFSRYFSRRPRPNGSLPRPNGILPRPNVNLPRPNGNLPRPTVGLNNVGITSPLSVLTSPVWTSSLYEPTNLPDKNNIICKAFNIFKKIKVIPKNILKPPPTIQDVLVDPAGLFYIKNGPNGASGASEKIYEWMGRSAFVDDKFPSNVQRHLNKETDSIFHEYNINGKLYTIIHTIGTDFRTKDYTESEAVELLSIAYMNTITQFIMATHRNNNIRCLRLLPISAGIFAGNTINIDELTMRALINGLSMLSNEELNYIEVFYLVIEMYVLTPDLEFVYNIYKDVVLDEYNALCSQLNSTTNVGLSGAMQYPVMQYPVMQYPVMQSPAFQNTTQGLSNGRNLPQYKLKPDEHYHMNYSSLTGNVPGVNANTRANANLGRHSRKKSILNNKKELKTRFNNSYFEEPNGHTDFVAVNRLVHIHLLTIDSILDELRHGNKKNHYIWWIFPTDKIGEGNKDFNTRVTERTYQMFLDNIDKDKWKEVLTIIASFENNKIDSPDDIGRIQHFCCFWRKFNIKFVDKNVPWLPEIIEALELKYDRIDC